MFILLQKDIITKKQFSLDVHFHRFSRLFIMVYIQKVRYRKSIFINEYPIYHIDDSTEPIRLCSTALRSHICNSSRSTDGNFYMFVVKLSMQQPLTREFIDVSNDDAHLALPTHMIVYQRKTTAY